MPPPIQPGSQFWGSAPFFKDLFTRPLTSLVTFFFALSAIQDPGLLTIEHSGALDPCAEIAGRDWVNASEVRACFTSFQVDPVEKANIVTACSKILDFHTSTNYQIKAPKPFSTDVQWDIIRDLERINGTHYPNDLLLHIDVSRSFNKLRDGHAWYINRCYDYLYFNFIPLPLVHLTDSTGKQHVHIAPEAFAVARAEFPAEQIKFWQDSLLGDLKGNLELLNGAEVLAIDGKPPYQAVDENASVSGDYQGLGTRQNSFFSSYLRTASGWDYVLGDFARQSLPLSDSVTLKVLRKGKTDPETFTIPFLSRRSGWGVDWTDSVSFRANNCKANVCTNGYDHYAPYTPNCDGGHVADIQQRLKISPGNPHELLDVIPDDVTLSNAALPPGLEPDLPPVRGSQNVSQFYYLDYARTGVLALGSFQDKNLTEFRQNLFTGLKNLHDAKAEQLIVDVTNNGGGSICIAHLLRRFIAGAKNATELPAGFHTQARAQPLAQNITAAIAEMKGPSDLLLYDPTGWTFADNTPFPEKYDWLKNPVRKVINGHEDFFSQKLGRECAPPNMSLPLEGFFKPEKVVIVSNGQCGSSCSLFSIMMSKLEGAKTVVFGGRKGVKQQYCGFVGGQSSNFATIKSDIKTTNLTNHPRVPPDFVTSSEVGVTWRLALGIQNPEEPEEWQDHQADYLLDLTEENVNNPVAIWNDTVKAVFKLQI